MPTGNVALGVAAGYLLGRTKKMRLAITLGSMIAGKHVSTSPAGLLRQAGELVEKNPQLAELQQRVTGELFDAARSAALATATSRLQSANRALLGPADDEDQDDEDDDEYEDEDEYDQDEYDEDEEDDEPEDEPEDELEDEQDDEPEDEPEDELDDEQDDEDDEDDEPEDEFEDEDEPEDEADDEP